jgi:ATP-dependent protease HslVU (ClpYQ) peptidase subunit
MTAVVVIAKPSRTTTEIVIGSESRITEDTTICRSIGEPKYVEIGVGIGTTVIGYAGGVGISKALINKLVKARTAISNPAKNFERLSQLLESEITRLPKEESDPGWELVVINRGRIWKIDEDLTISEYEKFTSLGDGCEVANGAYFALQRAYGENLENIDSEEAAKIMLDACCYNKASCAEPLFIRKYNMRRGYKLQK